VSHVLPDNLKTGSLRFHNIEAQLLYLFSAFALVAIAVANHTHIETNDHIKLAPQVELLARLSATGFGGLIGLYGIIFIKRVRDGFFTFPGAWVLGLWTLFVVSTIFSPFHDVAIPHLLTFTSVVLFAPTAFAVLGTRMTILLVIGAIMMTLAASWFLYLFMPEYGVMIELTDSSGDYGVERMGGTSHPNVLAGSSVLCFVATLYLMVGRKLSLFWTIPIAFVCLATLAMTGTRVAVAAGFLSIMIVYRGVLLNRKVFPFVVGAAALVVLAIGVSLASDTSGMGSKSLLQSLTRSGDVDEISTLTGRAEIWEYCIKKIGESPVIGYGPGSPKPMLETQDTLLHTHNVILHMSFVGGLLGGFCVIMLFLHQAVVSLKAIYPLPAMISIIILMNSMTENPIFDYVPGAPTILFLVAIFWPTLDDGSL